MNSVETRGTRYTRLFQTIINAKAHPFLLVALSAIIYLPSISYPFVYDTKHYLFNSPFVKEFPLLDMLRDIPGFVRCHSLVMDPDFVVNFVLRPFCYFTFHLNYLIGGMAAEGYRIVNLGIHALTTLLIYAFLKHLLTMKQEDTVSNWAAGISFCCAALFTVNPIQSEAVTYTVQRFTTLATCLYITSIYGHLRGMDAKSRNAGIAWQCVSLVALVFGMLTKELVFTAPIMMVMLSLVVLRRTLRQAFRDSLFQICCMPLIPLLMFSVERGDQTPGVDLDDMINIVNYSGRHPFEYLVTQIRALLSYFRLLIIPYGQSFQHTYPIHTSLYDFEVVISLALILLFVIAAYRLARHRNDILANLIAYFIIWYIVTFSVTSSIIPLDEIFVERRAYLPSVGLIAGIALQIVRVGKQRRTPAFSMSSLAVFAMVMIVLYTSAAFSRVKVWSSKLTLWQDVVEKYPYNSVALNDLGFQYLKRDDYAKAILYLKRSIKITPALEAYQNLGSAYINSGNYLEATRVYQEGLNYFCDDYLLLTGAGAANSLSGEIEKGLYYLRQAISIDPQGMLALQYYEIAVEQASKVK